MTCDVGGTMANKTNAGTTSCGTFAQSSRTLTDALLYTPIFGPVNTDNASNGQPWYFQWLSAEWFYRSDMQSSGATAFATGQFWSADYTGSATPAQNEIDTQYPYFSGYFVYPNQSWDSATPWDPANPPANYDAVTFGSTASGLATSSTQWRWAFEGFDADFGGNPQTTAATAGLAVDDMNLVYDEYHAIEQIGTCDTAAAT